MIKYLMVGLALVLAGCEKKPTQIEQVTVWTDDGTKCQYLITAQGGITRRLGDHCPAQDGLDAQVAVTTSEDATDRTETDESASDSVNSE